MPHNPHADFTPTLKGYSGQEPFRFWCQLALPLTYDDSLSYYELLNKVVTYLNHTIEDVSNMETNVGALHDAYVQLQNYVNDYFDNIDIEAELRNVLDKMALDGSLDALLDPLVANHLPEIVESQIDDVVAEQIDGSVEGQIGNVVAEQLPPLVDENIPGEVSNWLGENVNPVGSAVMVDSSLTISGAAADAKVTGDELNYLKTQIKSLPFNSYNVYAECDTVFKGKNWASGTGVAMTDDTDRTIYRVIIDASKKYYLVKPSGTAYSNSVRFADSSNTYLGIANNGLSALNTPPENSYYMYFSTPARELPVAVIESDLQNYNAGYRLALSDTVFIDAIDNLSENLDGIQDELSDMIAPSVNLADPNKFTLNKYMTEAGYVGNNSSYFYTDKIPVAEGDVVYWNSARYRTAFDSSGNVVTASGTIPFTVPAGVTSLILTGYMSGIDSFIVTKNTYPPFIPYGNKIDNDYLSVENLNALNGNDGITITTDSLNADTTQEITSYPKIIASHDRLSGFCKFSELDEIFFGYGYGSNKYCGVTSTDINFYVDGNLSTSVAHEMTISDYLAFSIIMNNERQGLVTINSTGGSATATLSLGYNKNGLPFIRSTTALTNVKLSAICTDIRKPIWWFGDSYSSLAPERIIGQLDNYKVVDNMLIDAVPGGRSYYNDDTGGYPEFIKLTKLAHPKYVIWALGMNDTEANYKLYLKHINDYCKATGITLYAVKIPSVPSIDNTGKNAYIDELEIPAIDWASAVNATAQGVWYSNYLSSDQVHPTVKGAQAMAARTLVDCPTIMQF